MSALQQLVRFVGAGRQPQARFRQHLEAGMAAYRDGNAAVSIAKFQECLEIYPERWDVWQLMAAVHLEITGDVEEAVRLLRYAKRKRSAVSGGRPPYRFVQAPWGSDWAHIASLEYLIKREILQGGDPKNILLLASPDAAAHPLLQKMASSYVTVVDREKDLPLPVETLLSVLEDPYLCKSLDGLPKQSWHAFAEIQRAWEAAKRGPLLTLSTQEREMGLGYLRRLGVPDGAWFVCLHCAAQDWAPYTPAIQAVTQRGGWVIRLGGAGPLSPAMRCVLDRAGNTNNAIEMFLLGACRFFIGTASGHAWVPPLYGVPCVLTDWAPAGRRPLNSRDLYIPTLYNAGSPSRLLSFGELMAPPLGQASRYERAQALKLRAQSNTADEIAEAVEEMLMLFDGTLRYSERDEILQSAFDAVAHNSLCFGSARIGRAFLRRYASLLMNVSNF